MDNFKSQLEALIQDHLALPSLDNMILAKKLYLSESQFYRMVKKHYGISPNMLIRETRLKHACKLLSSAEVETVKEAASAVGYNHVGYFIRRFEEFYGATPATYLRAALRSEC